MLKKQSSEYQIYAGLSRHFNGALFFSHALIFNKNPQLWMDIWQVLRSRHHLKHAISFSARLTYLNRWTICRYILCFIKICARSSVDRASASGAGSRWFEPSRAYHNKYNELKVLLTPILLPIKFISRKQKGNQGK